MEKNDGTYRAYLEILREELIPAMGCTEPIALAYASAKAREILGALPERCFIEASGNIVKNVKSVVVPHTGGLKGMEAAAAAGIVAGKADKALEVIAAVSGDQIKEIQRFLEQGVITVKPMATEEALDIAVTLYQNGHSSYVRITGTHTNIIRIEKDGEVLLRKEEARNTKNGAAIRELLNMADIVAFAELVDLSEVKEVIGRQIDYNTAIVKEGFCGSYGANIGKVLLHTYGNDVKIKAKAAAAAGSDARMSGCELPVVINSGSGNQGITVSIPVIVYAEELGVSEERLYRALVLSNLTAIHQKSGIGRLSAYCGAVSAGCAAGCGIAYLRGGDLETISHTLVNALAIVSGIICDGAKPSCAAKIAASVDAGILGYAMYREGQQFYGGDGIVSKGVENTIGNVGRLGKEGMKETDKEIIRIMTGC